MKTAPVSVVIPAFGHAEFIQASIQSVLSQQPAPTEIIVVNDSSPDNTSDVLRPYVLDGRIRYVKQRNAGMAAARNTGARLATQEFLYFLDDDDIAYPGTLAALTDVLSANRDVNMAYGDAVLFRDRVPPPEDVAYATAERVDRVPFMLFNQLGSPGQVLLRRRAFELAGAFDVGIWGADDWDLWMRLLAGAPAVYLRRPVLAYRLHAHNASRNIVRMYQSSRTVAHRHLKTFPQSERAILRRYSSMRLREYHVPRLRLMFMEAVAARRWGMAASCIQSCAQAWASEAIAYTRLKVHLLKRNRWSLPTSPLSERIMQHCGRL